VVGCGEGLALFRGPNFLTVPLCSIGKVSGIGPEAGSKAKRKLFSVDSWIHTNM
jgi:hypothetical protein